MPNATRRTIWKHRPFTGRGRAGPKVILKWALGLYIAQAVVGIVAGLALALIQTGVI